MCACTRIRAHAILSPLSLSLHVYIYIYIYVCVCVCLCVCVCVCVCVLHCVFSPSGSNSIRSNKHGSGVHIQLSRGSSLSKMSRRPDYSASTLLICHAANHPTQPQARPEEPAINMDQLMVDAARPFV